MNIGVFFGSRSAEHDVSIITGQLIISELKKMGHNPIAVYISKTGQWCLGKNLDSLKSFVSNTNINSKDTAYYLDLENSQGKLVFKQKGLLGQEITIDMAFPAFHGTYGEDGTFQGIMEMLNVPYVGCDVASSAVAMDKILTKQILDASNIPNCKYVWSSKEGWQHNNAEFINQIKTLQLPIFIKPAHMGSSIGISKVKSWEELTNALEIAFHYDSKVLVEEGVNSVMDVTCAILEKGSGITPSLLQESTFGGDMFDYETKYLGDSTSEAVQAGKSVTIPAGIDPEQTQKIQGLAVQVFKLLGCSGTARVDFLINKDTKQIFVTEVNPLPGTLYHHLWEKSGVSIDTLIQHLLDNAEKRHTEKSKLTLTFDSPILTQLEGAKMGGKISS